MKNLSLFSSRCQRAAQGLLLGLALFASGSAGAQNFVRNPNLALPLGTNNWTVVYSTTPASSPADFWIKDRTLFAHRDASYGTWDGQSNFDYFYPTGPCYFGLHFRPYTHGEQHAWFDQVVTGLTPGVSYVVTAWMVQEYSDYVSDVQVWMEALGTSDVVTPYVTGYAFQNNGWASYSVTTTANAKGQIEVRLHCYKNSYTGPANNVWLNIDAFYDHISVMPAVQTPLPQPRLLSLAVTNQTMAFKWSTIMNNTDDILISPDLVNWSNYQTGIVAIASDPTFTTNLVMSFTTNLPAPPTAPQFYRILSHNYVP